MGNNLYLIHYKPKKSPIKRAIFASSVRQYFVDRYPHPCFHNHYPDGKSIYRSRGAPFQFKVINNEVFILSLNEGVKFAHSFQWPESINMPLGRSGVVLELKLISRQGIKANFQETKSRCYRNLSPYIALNQERHKIYVSLSDVDKRKSIEKGLSNHILSAAKWCGINVGHRIKVNLIQVRQRAPKKIKEGLFLMPFDVMFECNTEVPDYFGIGKFVSRGYGTVVRYG